MFFFISLVLTHILFCFVFLITFKFIDVDSLFIYLFSSCYITSFLICIILIKTKRCVNNNCNKLFVSMNKRIFCSKCLDEKEFGNKSNKIKSNKKK